MKKIIIFSLTISAFIFSFGLAVFAEQTATTNSGSSTNIKASCQNFPPPTFCPGGINDIIVTGTHDNGCSTYGCKSGNPIQSTSTKSILIGGDRDEHGCLGPAGYSWCGALKKCIRPWEKKCEKSISTSTDATCIMNAVEKRDNAIITAWDKEAAAIKKVLTDRRDAIKSAFAQTDKKKGNAIITKAWKNYTTAVQKAKKEFNTSKLRVWKQYHIDRKPCKTTANTDVNVEKADNAL